MNSVQEKILEIYDCVRKICNEGGICFYAIGGTCLGAVRHGGFIPWDDDIDIAIPIEDFERFLDLCYEKLPESLTVCTARNQPHNLTLFCKIMDRNTTFIENTIAEFPDAYRGVFVDIMPLSGLPKIKVKRDMYIIKLRILAALNAYRRLDYGKNKSVHKRIVNFIIKPFISQIPYYYFSEKIFQTLKRYSVGTSEFVGYVWSPKRLKKLTFSKKAFSESVNLPFENTVMSCPIGYDEFLSGMFGDYMQLPPEKDRISGHIGFIDLITPYAYYQEYYNMKGELPWKKQ